jgi:hypothetical protein
MKIQFTFFMLLISNFSWSQVVSEVLIQGKVHVKSDFSSQIEVINVSNSKTARVDEKGIFFIKAKVNDVLLFHGSSLENKEIIIKLEHISSMKITVEMLPKVIELDEVLVKVRTDINAINLGIVSKDVKQYTPAERKLKTAGDFKPIHLLSLLGGSMPLDPLINKITGRTAMLKKGVIAERKEYDLYRVSLLYEDLYYINTLKIPQEYIKDFQYYLIEDPEFLAALNAKNRMLMLFLSSKLAVSYNKIVK